jgi:hypothetical protein
VNTFCCTINGIDCIAYKFCWKQFYEPIKQLISLDFENFILNKEFNELNVKELMDYLRDDRIRVRK